MKFKFNSVVSTFALLSAAALMQAQDTMVAKSADSAKPIKVGEMAPNSTLKTMDNKDIELKDVLAGKPTVLVFYQGGWDNYSSKHLADIQKAQSRLMDMGYQVVAISPDKPDNLKDTKDMTKAGYMLLSDSKADALKNFGVAYHVDDMDYGKYQDAGNDLEKAAAKCTTSCQ